MAGLTIKKAAEAAGVGVETIRFYERRGLIEQPPKPANGGFRAYPDETIRRIRFIRQAQELGFSLREAGELTRLRARPGADAREVQARAVAKLADVEAKIRALQDIEQALKHLIATCPGRGPLAGCSIIEALDRITHSTGRRCHEKTASGEGS